MIPVFFITKPDVFSSGFFFRKNHFHKAGNYYPFVCLTIENIFYFCVCIPLETISKVINRIIKQTPFKNHVS
jgi:ABC-type amino acid transport system permease subunit